MTIEDLLNLTEGTLVNQPEIHAIEGATAFPSKVDHGDLFFGESQENIDAAIANGAYAIVYDSDAITMTDETVAWIKVDSVPQSAFRLLRYVLLSKEADFYLLNAHEMTFFKMITTHKGNITFLSNEWHKAFEQILNGEGNLFVGTDEQLMRFIQPEITRLVEQTDGYRISDTLFRSTFRIGKYVYQDIKITPLHIDHLMKVVALCDRHELPYEIDRIQYTHHFMPLFIDNNLHSAPQGSSDRALIFTDNVEDIVRAREYVRYQISWVKSIVLTPPKTKVENVERPYWYSSIEEARDILKNTHYNYAFVYSMDKKMFQSFDTPAEEQTLF